MGEEIRSALRLLCPSLLDVANALGVSHDTAKGWSAGRTNPSPENRAALAAYARKRARELERLAEELQPTEPFQPTLDQKRAATTHVVHDLKQMATALRRLYKPKPPTWAWTAWYAHCRAIMDFFRREELVRSDDILAVHYVPAAEWKKVRQATPAPEAYDDYRKVYTNKLVAHLTYDRVRLASELEGRDYRPSLEVTEYLLTLGERFYDLLNEDWRPDFGYLADATSQIDGLSEH